MKFVCPLVVVEDINRSRDLYENVLGQSVKSIYGENITFKGDFAIHQKTHFRSLIEDKEVTPKANSSELYFEDDDPVAVQSRILDAGLELVHPVREQPWRQQVVRFYDYDGNLLEVGESMEHTAWRLFKEGKPLDEICRITYLDRMAVETAIRDFEDS